MNDPEEFLQRFSPRGPDPAVVATVRAAMARELARPRGANWERRLGWATAAAILFGIALNYVAAHVDQQRRDRWISFDTTQTAAHEVGKMVESATDAETGAWVEQQFVQARQKPVHSRSAPDAYEQYIQLILRETDHANSEENAQAPRDRPRNLDRGGACRQCGACLADRETPGRTIEQIADGRGSAFAA